tara:strand:+ start:348 stop:1511 length:1164 start_codon:yes stop_codon:yes gene_type:complete
MDAEKSVDYIGAGQAGFNDHTFGVKLCESSFDYTKMPDYKVGDETLVVGAPEASLKHGNAYWTTADGTNFTPEYSFLSGNFASTQDEDTEKYNGWTVTYASIQKCSSSTTEAPEPFVFTMNGICDATAKTGTWSDYTNTADCAASVTYTGVEGCPKFDGNAFMDAVKPFTGVILILVGGLMTFAGAKFLFQLVSAFVTGITFIVFYSICSNLFFDAKTAAWMKVIVLILALALGVAAAYFSYKLTTKFAIPIVAGAGGAFGFKLITNVAGIRNEYAALAIMIVGIAVGVFLGMKLNFYVKTIGTAFLGSYMFTRGLGYVFGGFPEVGDVKKLHEIKGHDKILYYFLGFIALFIAGSVVQYKLFHVEGEEKDDTFVGEDDGEKKCGCF